MASGCVSGAPSAARAPVRTFVQSSARTFPEPVLRARTDTLSLKIAVIALLIASVAARPALAQAEGSWLERLGIDKLRFTALGAQVGRVNPHGIDPASAFALQVDYGEITTGWRVVFNATYWDSRFRDRNVRAYADSLLNAISDPDGDAVVVLGNITVSDIALGADVRRTFFDRAVIRPYLGGGLATHI